MSNNSDYSDAAMVTTLRLKLPSKVEKMTAIQGNSQSIVNTDMAEHSDHISSYSTWRST